MQRTEQDKVTFAPIKAQLGEKTYDIKPLRVLPQQRWRRKLVDDLTPIVEKLEIGAVNNKVFLRGLSAILSQFPETLIDLVFAYAPYLPKDEIMNEETGASEEQFGKVFQDIYDLVFQDFLAQLGTVTSLLMPAVKRQQSATPTT